MSRYIVAVTDDRYFDYTEEKKVLETIGAEVIVHNCTTPEQVVEKCKDADALLCNLAPITSFVAQSLPKCKVISRYGVGYDNVDVPSCAKNGIVVTHVVDYCTEEVSDQALALLLACVRKTARRDRQIREGLWNIGRSDKMYQMAGKVFGFIGFGAIARVMHRKIKGFNFSRILAYDPYLNKTTADEFNVELVDLDTIITDSDYISIHAPLTPQTKGIINLDAFKRMKNTAIIVATSRGGIIDESALAEALQKGYINSAGLDVHTVEPLPKNSPLIKLENCVLSDHVGWYSEDSISRLKECAAENVKAVLTGQKPSFAVQP